MNELIKINYENDTPTVSARDLHEFLEVGTKFKDWFPRMCEYGFTNGVDYTPLIFEHPQNHQPTTDYALAVEMAKELCMIQRTERGKQARQYFIQLEKDWNSPEKVMARALRIAENKIKQLSAENTELIVTNEQQRQAIADFEPIRQYVDTILESPGTMAITQIAADYDLSARQLNHILHEEGIQRKVNGQWILYKQHMGKGYTKSKTFEFTRSDGRTDSKVNTEWTQKGRLMIHEILTRRGIIAVMDRRAAM